MPLPYADPTRPKSGFARGVSKVFGTAFGQSFIKNVAAKTDPRLGRVSNGRLSWSLGIVPTATLRTTGAKSGQPRDVQLTYFHDGPDPIAVASNYGGGKNPLWSRNLLAHPDCELGGYADYKAKTALVGRHIPMFRLTAR